MKSNIIKISLSCLAFSNMLSADPLISYPGTKAKAMGGAFTAVANNTSAMYFNPAGLISQHQESSALTAEFGSGVKIDQAATNIDDIVDTSFTYFIGGYIQESNFAFGAAVYSLYEFSLKSNPTSNTSNYYTQDISVLSGSLAYTLLPVMYPYSGKLAIGATVGCAFSGAGFQDFYSATKDGKTINSGDDNTLDQRGYFYQVGLKARVINTRVFTMDIGASYRSEAELENVDGTDRYGNTLHNSADFNGINLPAEIAYGIAASYNMSIGALTIAADLKETAYTTATKNSDFSFRLDDTKTQNLGLDMAFPSFQVRGGIYKSTAKDQNINLNKIDTNGKTVGIAYSFTDTTDSTKSGGINIELSYDIRDYDFGTKGKTSENFVSISINASSITF